MNDIVLVPEDPCCLPVGTLVVPVIGPVAKMVGDVSVNIVLLTEA